MHGGRGVPSGPTVEMKERFLGQHATSACFRVGSLSEFYMVLVVRAEMVQNVRVELVCDRHVDIGHVVHWQDIQACSFQLCSSSILVDGLECNGL